MHIIGIFLAVFAALWLWSLSQRRRAERDEQERGDAIYRGLYGCDRPKPPRS
jgi:hypothetical protein